MAIMYDICKKKRERDVPQYLKLYSTTARQSITVPEIKFDPRLGVNITSSDNEAKK